MITFLPVYPFTASMGCTMTLQANLAELADFSHAHYDFGPGVIEWRRGCLVRLEDQFRKCGVLIGSAAVGSDDEIDPWGSGFLVDADVANPAAKYLITTWHVVAQKEDAPFDVRFNKHGGGARNFHIDDPHWVTHPSDNTIDVAVHSIDIPDWADCSLVPRSPTVMGPEKFRSKDIGAGNRTYTVGLWRFLHGDKRNQPFVFTGHIGLVPEDQKVSIASWLPDHNSSHVEVDAYLVEGEPLDGASGSPVFVRRTLGPWKFSESGKLKGYVEGSIWLLGIQSNAWFGKPDETYQIKNAIGTVVVPRGVNAVIPSMKINEVLEHPDLKKRREDGMEAKRKGLMPMKTKTVSGVVASSPPATDENPTHREDFRRLSGVAAQKQKQDE